MSKKTYANLYPESNFEDKVKEWNNMWNYSHSIYELEIKRDSILY